jgi:uncharacterized phage protein (TIGR01671 family)
MSREIKFRAWDNQENRFIDLNGFSIGFNSMPYPGLVYGVTEQGVLREKCSDELTIEQYTGLKDKNGVEIYEGDRLEGDNDVQYIVTFDNGSFIGQVGGFFRGDKVTWERGYLLRDFQLSSITVIGNIHQNPELL